MFYTRLALISVVFHMSTSARSVHFTLQKISSSTQLNATSRTLYLRLLRFSILDQCDYEVCQLLGTTI
uniref:Secreted protein n=1 Tax=Anguilla anguilla TaxID=7936 RepID=A0A0E9WF08_ANGAN